MKIVYILILCMLILIMSLCMKKSILKGGDYGRAMAVLFIMGIVTVASETITILSINKDISTLTQGIYYASIDFLLICVLKLMRRYTKNFEDIYAIKMVVYSCASIDLISMIVNTYFHHIFTMEKYVLGNGDIIYTTPTPSSIYFRVHLIFTYIIVFAIFFSLLSKVIVTSKYYRKKYSAVLVVFTLIVIINAICLYFDFIVDLSVVFYALMAIVLYYFSVYYVSRDVIKNILSIVANGFSSAVVCFGIDGDCIYKNRFGEKMLLTIDKGEIFDDIFLFVYGDDNDKEERNINIEKKISIDGKEAHFNVEYNNLYDKNNEFICRYMVFDDRTDEINKFYKEKYIAEHDELTGLYNTKHFYDVVSRTLEENPYIKRYMICSNIKDFKIINDCYGITKGNEILINQANAIREVVSENTVYGRLAGDKFAACIPADEYDEEGIKNVIKKMSCVDGTDDYIMHIYIGVYEIEDVYEMPSVMCDKANMAIEKMRGDYDSWIAYYDKELLEKNLYEKRVVGEFNNALTEEQFCIFLQPQVDVNGKLLGAEALVRWQHPKRGLIFPGGFIDILENTGLIYKLDRKVWELAAKQLAKWKKAGREDLHISINISTKDFFYMDIYKYLTELVEKYDIDKKKLKLEITETAIMSDTEKTLNIIDRLREYEFEIEIDDFGSGYSSLNTLKDINADIIKLDMGFLRETTNEKKSKAIINTVAELAKSLGMAMISEGVETKEQVDYLANIGCEMFQGYYFSKPIPVDEFEKKYFG